MRSCFVNHPRSVRQGSWWCGAQEPQSCPSSLGAATAYVVAAGTALVGGGRRTRLQQGESAGSSSDRKWRRRHPARQGRPGTGLPRLPAAPGRPAASDPAPTTSGESRGGRVDPCRPRAGLPRPAHAGHPYRPPNSLQWIALDHQSTNAACRWASEAGWGRVREVSLQTGLAGPPGARTLLSRLTHGPPRVQTLPRRRRYQQWVPRTPRRPSRALPAGARPWARPP